MKTLSDLEEKLAPLQRLLVEMPLYHTWNVLVILAESYAGNIPDSDAPRSIDRLRAALATAIVESGSHEKDKVIR